MVQERNPIMVLILTLCTFGIYGIYWVITTKNEMNELGAEIPTAWLILVPIVNIWWMYKYCEGWEQVTKSETSALMVFIVYIVFAPIAIWIVQDNLNKIAK